MKNLLTLLLLSLVLFSCKKDKTEDTTPATEEPKLIIKFKFDSTQARLDNFGHEAIIPAGNAGQSPKFHLIAAHYVELTTNDSTQVGEGAVIYNGANTEIGGAKAIDFDQEVKVAEGEVFLSIPLKDIPAGEYKYIRVSLAYQNYDVKLRANGIDLTGRLASFVGFNTYVRSYKVKDSSLTINANKLQGYWGFESIYSLSTGQAPKTTVPNPLAATSPIPAGSCLVTGQFAIPFVLSSGESKNINMTISLSINKSFEWQDTNPNGIWEPLLNENVVDMGLRGLIPIVTK